MKETHLDPVPAWLDAMCERALQRQPGETERLIFTYVTYLGSTKPIEAPGEHLRSLMPTEMQRMKELGNDRIELDPETFSIHAAEEAERQEQD